MFSLNFFRKTGIFGLSIDINTIYEKLGLCKTDDIKIDDEFVVNFTDFGKQIMIVDSCSPVSFAYDLEIGEMKI